MSIISELSWDSRFFGVKTGRIIDRNLNEEDLERSLQEGRDTGYGLIYLFRNSTHELPEGLLNRYGGKLVDYRKTYCGEIPALCRQVRNAGAGKCDISEYPKQSADEELLQLGVLAGRFSRFHADNNIPDSKFVELYHNWVDKSTKRELADQVFVATLSGGTIAGFVSLTIAGDKGAVRLIAVSSEFQGQGIGTSLLSAAHDWMHCNRAVQSSVVTQRQNTSACRLYTRTGYTIQEEAVVYHFWL